MTIPVELFELRSRLEEVGMVVVEEPNHLTIRLPYFCSVRVYLENGRLRFDPYFGLMARTRSTLIKVIGVGFAAVLSGIYGGPYTIPIIAFGLMAGFYDVIRVIVTENVISRAGAIYSQFLHAPRSDAGGASTLGAVRPRELNAGDTASRTPDELPRSTVESIINRR